MRFKDKFLEYLKNSQSEHCNQLASSQKMILFAEHTSSVFDNLDLSTEDIDANADTLHVYMAHFLGALKNEEQESVLDKRLPNIKDLGSLIDDLDSAEELLAQISKRSDAVLKSIKPWSLWRRVDTPLRRPLDNRFRIEEASASVASLKADLLNFKNKYYKKGNNRDSKYVELVGWLYEYFKPLEIGMRAKITPLHKGLFQTTAMEGEPTKANALKFVANCIVAMELEIKGIQSVRDYLKAYNSKRD